MGNTAPYVVSFLLRFIYGVMQVLLKVAFNQGMSIYVLVFYRHVIATMFLLPVAIAIERKATPQLSYKVRLKLFMHALYGMESLKLKRFHGILEVSGIVLCAAGVTVLALYQGPKFKYFVHHPLFHHPSRADAHPSRNWILGILLQSLAAVMFALWTVFQGPLLVEYPSMLLNTAVRVVFATVQSVFIALVMERGLSRWKLSLDVGLCRDHLLCKYMRIPSAAAANHCFIGRIVTVEVEKENLASVGKLRCDFQQGIAVSAFSNYLQLWLVDKRGPVLVDMTAPLTFVITVILSLLIGEAGTLGSVTCGALMVGSLYNVLWGRV